MADRPPPSPLRRSLKLAYANGALWGVGSGLASMSLIAYFARELQASGLAISWILAAPSLVGLTRLLTPLWLDRVGSRRRFCVGMSLASAVAMGLLPVVAAPGAITDDRHSLIVLGLAWTASQALEFFAVVALWSWFGDLIPAVIRGRFIGRREAWLTAGLVMGGLAAAMATWAWRNYCDSIERPDLLWKSYAACASFGAALGALATLPLSRMAEPTRQASVAGSRAREMLAALFQPLRDPRFMRLMAFGVCYSIANGLVQSPRQLFIASSLKIELAEKRALDATSRGMQILLMPWIGRWVDRRGNVPLLTASWGIVSLATLFLLVATPEARWWIVGAYACWVAYAGLNVTLPNLMLGLSPPRATGPYAAAWFAWTQLAYSLSILGGGYVFDLLSAQAKEGRSTGSLGGDPFTILFAVSGAIMLVGVALAGRIREPTEVEQQGRVTSELHD